MHITIRNLKKEDADQVARLINQLTKNIIKTDNLVPRIEQLSAPLHWQYLVAEVDGQVTGFGGLVWYPIPSKGLCGWIEELVVDAKNRRHGIGTALMEKLINLAQSKNIVRIRLTSTPKAKNIYHCLGFIKKDHEYLIKDL